MAIKVCAFLRLLSILLRMSVLVFKALQFFLLNFFFKFILIFSKARCNFRRKGRHERFAAEPEEEKTGSKSGRAKGQSGARIGRQGRPDEDEERLRGQSGPGRPDDGRR